MTDFASLLVADHGPKARPIHLVDKKSFEAWLKKRPAEDRALLEAQRFKGKTAFASRSCPAAATRLVGALGVANATLSPWCLAKLGESLPEGTYRCRRASPAPAALGWLLGQYRFDRYREKDEPSAGPRMLLTGEPARIDETVRLAEATALVRDLVNTPAGDLGPAELEQAARERWPRDRARMCSVTAGDALDEGYPMIAAVGARRGAGARAAPDRARMGRPAHPRIAIVGKGVCFDSGGLDLKPASGMRLMKKDMGGAAHALALARLIIARAAAGPAPPADPGGRERRLGRRLPPRRHPQDAQGPVRRDRQYRRGRAADPRRRARPRGRGRARADPRFRDPDRRRAGRARPRPSRLFANDDALAADDLLAPASAERPALADAALGAL